MPRPPHRPRRRFGQNFLVDRAAIRKIAEALSLSTTTPVVEIGPGRGALTSELLARTHRLVAVEIDRDLAARLPEEIESDRLVCIRADVLDLAWEELHRAVRLGDDERLVLTGNLPYNISKPVVMKMLAPEARIGRAVLMFQKEVADRLTAAPGGKAYGPITVLAGSTFSIVRLFDLGPAAFRPRPKIRSTVTAWSLREDRPGPEQARRLRVCLRDCFRARRRTLLNNVRLALGLPEPAASARIAGAGLDPAVRPEDVDPDGYLRLSRDWPLAPTPGAD